MPIVPAKCTNCGANIEVDKNSDSTKCEFCKSKIIVEDAIAKYKIEVSGEVEIKNLPTLKNHIKLAERYYNDNEYEEALEQYSKICELDSNNCDAIVRRGICKSLLIRYPNFNINHITNGLKNVHDILGKEEDNDINKYIIQCDFAIKKIESNIDSYANANILSQTEVEGVITRLIICLEKKEYLFSLIKDDENVEIEIINSILTTISLINKKRRYNTGVTNRTGNRVLVPFSINRNTLNRINTTKNKYQTRYNYIMAQKNPISVTNTPSKITINKPQNILLIAGIGGIAVFSFFVLIIILAVLFGVYDFEGQWISGDETVEIKGENATIKSDTITYNGEYSHKSIDNGYIITIKDQNDVEHIYKYEEVNYNTISFCELKDDECYKYYTPIEKKDGYKYLTREENS